MDDAIIVGGGPAGLAAALTLGRGRRRVLLLDAGEGRNAPADAVHNLLAHDGTPPEELRRIGREQLAR
jgi:thioredoxin reductase